MYEVTTHELMVFVILGFCAGIFVSVYLTRLIEVVHLYRMVSRVITHILLMCVGIIEDVEFLKELKKKQMVDSGLSVKQVRHFEEVEERVMANWKESVILSIVNKAPPRFRSMMPFNNWKEAVGFLERTLKDLKGQ